LKISIQTKISAGGKRFLKVFGKGAYGRTVWAPLLCTMLMAKLGLYLWLALSTPFLLIS